MIAGLVADLQALTPLLLGSAFFATVWIFRNETKALMMRVSGLRAQHGELSLEASLDGQALPEPESDAGDAPAMQDEGLSEEPSQILAASAKSDAKEASQPTADDLRKQMIAAAFDRDATEAKRLFALLQASVEEPADRKKEEARWRAVAYMAGIEAGGLEQLKKLATDPAVAGLAHHLRGLCLLRAGNPREAADAFRAAADAEPEEARRNQYVVQAAEAYVKLGERERGIGLIGEALVTTEPGSLNAVPLWEGMASIQEGVDQELQGVYLHAAAALAGNDPSLWFRASFALAQVDEDHLAGVVIHGYETCLRFDSKRDAALNNLGVQLERQDLDLMAVDYYLRAWKEGNTLAAANLAYKQIAAGFGDEAQMLLREASRRDNPHENVALATARLAEQRAEDESRRERLRDTGQRQATLLAEFAIASTASVSPQIAGTWRHPDGHEVRATQHRDSIDLEWTEADVRYRLKGTVLGCGARLEYQEMTYWTFSGERRESTWKSAGRAFGVFSSDGLSLRAALATGNTVEMLEFTDRSPADG